MIQYPAPSVDGGSFPAKRCVGDLVSVAADIFRDGHDELRAVVRYRAPAERRWREGELKPIDAHLGGIRWAGEFEVDSPGRWLYTVEVWTDVFGTWRDELERKLAAGQEDLSGELSEGVVLLREGVERARKAADRALIEQALLVLEDESSLEPAKAVLGEELFAAVERAQERHGNVSLDPPIAIEVDRVRARFGAWYELFPRSWGGLEGVKEALPALAELGFDIVYLPPIHPIGVTPAAMLTTTNGAKGTRRMTRLARKPLRATSAMVSQLPMTA